MIFCRAAASYEKRHRAYALCLFGVSHRGGICQASPGNSAHISATAAVPQEVATTVVMNIAG